MTIKDIKVDYGAKGDGQKVTDTVTSATSSPTVTFGGNHFTAGGGSPDIGKYIAIGTAAANFSGIYDTIAAVPAANQITLAHNATAAFAGTSQTLEWGTNDCAAFQAFRDAFAGVAGGVTLNIPDGRYCFAASGLGVGLSHQITPLQITGGSANGVVWTDMLGAGRGFFLGGCISGQFNDDLHSARTATVNAGASTIVLSDPTKNVLFTVGAYALMTGFDIFGNGYPTDQQFYEFVRVTAISGANITIAAPLSYSYKSTWPLYFGGNASTVDCGGPATLYALENGWDCDQTYTDINIESQFQINSIGHTINYVRGSNSGAGILPTRNLNWTVTDYTQTLNLMEVDKLVTNMTIVRGTWRGFQFQSPSPDVATFTGPMTMSTSFQGCGKRLVMSGGVTIHDSGAAFGPTVAGVNSAVTIDGCAFDGLRLGGVVETSVTSKYTMSSGTLSRLKSINVATNASTAAGNAVLHFASGTLPTDIYAGIGVKNSTNSNTFGTSPTPAVASFDLVAGTVTLDHNALAIVNSGDIITFLDGPPQWAVPGGYCIWQGLNGAERVFRINDVDEDGTRIRIGTSEPGGFPAVLGLNGISTHPCPDFTMTNCTGCDAAVAWSQVQAHTPQGSRWKKTYSGNIGTGSAIIPVFGGKPSVSFDVTRQYVGANSPKITLDDPFVLVSNGSARTFWTPAVDLKIASKRSITLSGHTGSGGTDATLDVPDSNYTWLLLSQMTPKVAVDMSDQTGAPVSVTIDITTDQGIASGRSFVCNFQ